MRSLTPLLLAALLGCPQATPPAPPPPPDDAPLPPPEEGELVLVDGAYAFGTAPLRARGALSASEAPLSVGDFYARLYSRFGPPSLTDRRGFTYVLRHQPTGLILTASARGAGPQYGGGYRIDEGAPAPRPEQGLGLVANAGREPPGFLEAARRLEAFVASAPLADCEIVYIVDDTTLRSGARGGQAFDEALPDADAFARALAAWEKAPSGQLFDENGDRALDLWTERAAVRAAHAALRPRVEAYWRGAVDRLAVLPVVEDNEQIRALRWAQLWRTRGVSEDAALLARLEKLKPDPWPAALEALKP